MFSKLAINKSKYKKADLINKTGQLSQAKLSLAQLSPSFINPRDADLNSEDEDIEGGWDDEEEVGHVHHQEAGHDSVGVVGLVHLVCVKNCPW